MVQLEEDREKESYTCGLRGMEESLGTTGKLLIFDISLSQCCMFSQQL
jgi:hypothetical protein